MAILPFDHCSPVENVQDPDFDFLINNLFDPIEGISKETIGEFKTLRLKAVYIFQRFITEHKTHIGTDFFPVAQLILPQKDSRKYFIKHVSIIRIILSMYKIGKKTDDGKELMNWKRNFHLHQGKERLPQIVSRVVENRRYLEYNSKIQLSNPVKVSEINKLLDEIPLKTKISEQVRILKPIIDRLSIAGIRWLFTIILKEQTIRSYVKEFLYTYHPQAPEFMGCCKNLKYTIHFLSDGKIHPPEQFNPQVFYPFVPQTSEKLTRSYDHLVKTMKSGFFIEEKVDGDRMMLHYKDGKFKFYSRRTRDYTNLYGETFQHGSLTGNLNFNDNDPNFIGPFHKSTKSIILDGEMVAYDEERKCILPFGTLRQSAIQESVRQFNTTDMYKSLGAHPLFLIFDVVEFNGTSFIYEPQPATKTEEPHTGKMQTLEWRKQFLERVIKPVPNRLEILPYLKGHTVSDIKNAMKKIISQRCEGIMVKSVKGNYQVDTRSRNSIKIKPEYLEEFGDNLDLAIIGIIPAIKNSYMCGLYDEDEKVWKSFCTVANGFTYEDYKTIDRMIGTKFTKICPKNVKFARKKPELYIRPEDSIVLEIKARSVDNNVEQTYALGTTLHNLWCRRIREDKLIKETPTLKKFFKLRQMHSKNIDKQQSANVKRRKISSFTMTKYGTKQISDLFKHFQFVILTDYVAEKRIEITDLKKLVIKYGGTLCQDIVNTSDFQTVVISDKLVPACRIWLNRGFDILSPRWIIESVKAMKILQLEPALLFRAASNIETILQDKVDEFGDSYCIMPKGSIIDYLKNIPLSTEAHFSTTVYPDLLVNLFRGLKFKIISNDLIQKELLSMKLSQFNGTTTEECFHYAVVTNSHDRQKVFTLVDEVLNKISKSWHGQPIPRIVNESFIDESITNQILVDPKDHLFI